MEIGESFEETIHREVMEEVGLKVKNIRYYKSQAMGIL
ncbi:NUDIX domain-containing protein [Hungatella sp.]